MLCHKVEDKMSSNTRPTPSGVMIIFCDSFISLYSKTVVFSTLLCFLSGDDIWGECRCSVSESSPDDPEQQASVQTGRPAESALLHPSEDQVRTRRVRAGTAHWSDLCLVEVKTKYGGLKVFIFLLFPQIVSG